MKQIFFINFLSLKNTNKWIEHFLVNNKNNSSVKKMDWTQDLKEK